MTTANPASPATSQDVERARLTNLINQLQTHLPAARRRGKKADAANTAITHAFSNSKTLVQIRYQPVTLEMEITFRPEVTGPGRVCVYQGVSFGVFDELVNAESPGRHFNQFVRDEFACETL